MDLKWSYGFISSAEGHGNINIPDIPDKPHTPDNHYIKDFDRSNDRIENSPNRKFFRSFYELLLISQLKEAIF